MMRRFIAMLAVTLLLGAGAANAATKLGEPPLPQPLVMQQLRGAQVFYLGKFDELNGWVMLRGGQPEFYYATPGNKALVLGLLFKENGDLYSGEQLKALALSQAGGVTDMMASQLPQVPGDAGMANLPAPDTNAPQTPQQTPVPNIAAGTPPLPVLAPAPTQTPAPATAAAPLASVANTFEKETPAGKLFADTQKAGAIIWGNPTAPAFYAYVDPNCPHCQKFLRDIEADVTAGLVSVHMIPVAFDDASRQQAAFALAAGDGAQRMLAYAKGLTEALPVNPAINIEGVEANTAVLGRWNLMGTPMILYRAGKTNEVKLIRGRPLDIPGAVADLRGQK